MKLKCQRCEYIWEYKGKNDYFASCPSCLIHVRIKKSALEEISN